MTLPSVHAVLDLNDALASSRMSRRDDQAANRQVGESPDESSLDEPGTGLPFTDSVEVLYG